MVQIRSSVSVIFLKFYFIINLTSINFVVKYMPAKCNDAANDLAKMVLSPLIWKLYIVRV